MNKKLNKYCVMIDDEPYIFISFKTKEEIVDFVYSLHEEWDIHNVEEETGEDFINFLCENIGSDEALICLNAECWENYRYMNFNF